MREDLEDEIEPGQPLCEVSCPCCGAKLEIVHRDEEGTFGAYGSRPNPPEETFWLFSLSVNGHVQFSRLFRYEKSARASMKAHLEESRVWPVAGKRTDLGRGVIVFSAEELGGMFHWRLEPVKPRDEIPDGPCDLPGDF